MKRRPAAAHASRRPVRLSAREHEKRRARLVRLVESLPEAAAHKISGRHLSLEVRGRRFGYLIDNHHGDERLAINCKAPPGANTALVTYAPDRFHMPKYMGPRGWIGLWLDLANVDWESAEVILVDAYRVTAPKSLVASLDAKR
jgi:hypothetical protein